MMQTHKKPTGQKGYIALSSVLVLLVVTIIITVSASYLAIDTGIIALSAEQSATAFTLAESCAAEALLQINENNALPSTISFPEGSCSVTEHSHIGNDWDFSTQANVGTNTEEIRITASRTTTVTITNWQRIAQ